MAKQDLSTVNWQGENGAGHAARILGFLAEIGVPAAFVESLSRPTLLPGLDVMNGSLLIAKDTAIWPGDLLHEAGHIAVSSPEVRENLSEIAADPGEEMAAMAWSVAAARASNTALEVVFHAKGYRGGSEAMIAAFSGSGAPGVPLLAWWGMTSDPCKAADEDGYVFPTMLRWLR